MCTSRGGKARRFAKRRGLPAALLLCSLCLLLSACGNQPTLPQDPSAPLYESAAPDPSEPYSVDFRLTSGHHTAGVDFPAGTYHLEAIQWCGKVTSSNGSVDEAMGVTDYNTDGLNQYSQELSDVDLPAGTVLSLTGGVMLRMTCGDADPTPLTARSQEITESVTLTAGIYTAGEDFPSVTSIIKMSPSPRAPFCAFRASHCCSPPVHNSIVQKLQKRICGRLFPQILFHFLAITPHSSRAPLFSAAGTPQRPPLRPPEPQRRSPPPKRGHTARPSPRCRRTAPGRKSR